MKKIIKGVLHNGIGEIGSRFPLIVTELFIAKSLGPSAYGIWAMIQLVVTYNNFSHFGLLSGLARLEPKAIGEKKTESYLKKLHANSFYPVFLIDIVLIFPVVYYFIVILDYPVFLVQSLVVLGVLQQLYLYCQTRLQNSLDFRLLSGTKLAYSFVFMLLALFVVTFLDVQVYELVLCWCFAYLFVLLYLGGSRKIIPKFQFDIKILKSLLICGFPIFLFGLIKLGLVSADRFMIGIYYSKEELAIYNVSFQAMMLSSLFVGLISRVLAPHMFSMSDDENEAKREFYIRIKDISHYTSLYVSFVVVFLFALLLEFFLVEFRAGALLGVIAIYTGFYQGLNQFSIISLVSDGAERKLLIAFIVIFSIYVSFIYLLIDSSTPLLLIALFSFSYWFGLELLFCFVMAVENKTQVVRKNVLVCCLLGLCILLVHFKFYWVYLFLVLVGLVTTYRRLQLFYYKN